MEFRVLGGLEVVRDGTSVELRGARSRTLLAALLVHAGSVVSVERLADLLWGGDLPSDPRNAVQTAVARLRDRLGDPNPVVTRGPGYAIDVGPDEFDALRFDELVEDAHRQRHDPAAVRHLLGDALSLWRGAPYGEFADTVARAEALRLEERRTAAIEQLMEARLLLGEVAPVAAELEAQTARHPMRERLVELRMEALGRAGRAAEALAVHRAYRRRLVDETGLEPSPSVQELEARILRGELAGSSRPPVGAPHPSPGSPSVRLPPALPGRLVGREGELSSVRRAIADSAVVTITGVGGVGKTRLATEIATSELDGGEREVVWVELAAVDDPAAVAHVVAEAAAIDLTGASTSEAGLITALRDRHLLLVVDNAEHLIDQVADLVGGIARHCPAVDVLVTSRERLAVPGEQVVPLAPLRTEGGLGEPTPPAVELFRDRAARAGGDISTEQLTPVIDLCRELDGLPLAIELAAARAAALSPGRLLELLRTDWAGALGSQRGRPERHRDLWAVADWSYRLLTDDEQRLFEGLGIFAGSFDMEAAHDVCAAEGWSLAATTRHLAGLVERSLVSRAGRDAIAGTAAPDRYRLLRPLRELARQRAADRGCLPDLTRRYVDHVTRQVEQAARPPLEDSGRRRLEEMLDDVREVWRRTRATDGVDLLGRLVAALFRFEYLRRGVEFLGRADDVLQDERARGSTRAPQLFAAAAVSAWRDGDLARAEDLARTGTELGGGAEDPARRFAFEALGDVATFDGRLREAADHFREATRLARIADDPDTEALGLSSQALVHAYEGAIDEALLLVDEAAEVDRAGPGVRAFVEYARGECLADVDPQAAMALVNHAAGLASSAGAWFVDGVARVTSASLRARHGRPRDALPVFRELVDHWRRSGSWPQQSTTLRNLAELLVRVGADAAAVQIASGVRLHQADSAVFGTESERLASAMSTARSRLGQADFRAARRRGEAMTREQLVEYALIALGRAG